MQIGECEVSPHLLGASPLYFPPARPQGMCRLHSIHQVRSWVCDGETQRHMLTVRQSWGPWGPVTMPPSPIPGQASAESSLPPLRSSSLHPVPPVLMSRDLPSALGLGLPSANSGLFVVGCADSLSECVDAVFTQGPYQGW